MRDDDGGYGEPAEVNLRLVEVGEDPLRGLFSFEGPSNSGKTYSALRIATGMARVLACEIAMIDTEQRGNLYQREFKFRRWVLEPPFSPEAFMGAYEQLDRKYGIVITDNFSDEYEGPGGIAEAAAADKNPHEAAKWAKPKARHRRLMSRMRLLRSNHLLCLRASDKITIEEGEDRQGRKRKVVIPLGWQPHAEKNFVYDMTLRLFLPPNSQGKPEVRKTVGALRGVFNDGEQLTEAHGEALARWTKGEKVAREPVPVLTPPFVVLDADGGEWHRGPLLKVALTKYREACRSSEGRGAEVALRNASLLLFAASRAPADKAQSILQELDLARSLQASTGDLDGWDAPAVDADQGQQEPTGQLPL